MKHSLYHAPRVFRFSGSVGVCGTNNLGEVKEVQRIIIHAGYHLATGRTLTVNGQCGAETAEAIRWYQRLLNMSPTGLVHPADSWFIQALQNATGTHWRPRHTAGSLHVSEGQVTFDAEGLDYITAVEPFRQPHSTPQFSRILQSPPTSSSGVTLGRGYDMGGRSAGEIFSTVRLAGIEEYKAVICSKAEYLKGHQAGAFVKAYSPLVGEITHQQQIKLFEISYKEKRDYVRDVYIRQSGHIKDPVKWEFIDIAVKNVFVDILYQGSRTTKGLVEIIAAGQGAPAVAHYIENDPDEKRDLRRMRIRLESLK
ncbi:hypothetical protein J2125_003451 [Erwinia toletana]|uniref:Peptidoglycan binding-like domain-containing protein n=1 Tax=Winslowiella toletana TaxID=92490 RepID=A0ABS4PC96_9GAMM|nr:peptidoglycan-binding protein [Winslowiella toletana]MBP2170259.1 hypothetical protein [Winslowiella toletana]